MGVMAAVKALKGTKGSSLAAIKKYVAANYKVDIVKISPFLRKAIKKLVEAKKLIQVKGSFKLNKAVKEKKPKAKKPKKPAAKEGCQTQICQKARKEASSKEARQK